MSKRTSPAVIGAFVIGAVLLLTLGFAIFGGSQLFTKTSRYVAYFDEPTDGLRTGANVLLNGVRIGYVSDIDLLFDRSNFSTLTQVTMDILDDSYVIVDEGELSGEIMTTAVEHDTLVDMAGLRAKLEVESFVTGQLWVVLELDPTSTAVFRGVDPPYPEIPTQQSDMQQILVRLQDWLGEIQDHVNIGELAGLVTSVLEGIDEIAHSEDLRAAIAGINDIVNDDATQQLATELSAAIEELRLATTDARALIRNAEGNLDSIAADLGEIESRIGATLEEAERTLSTARQRFRGDSEQVYRLSATLDELERAARSMREFFDYIERNPEALIRGKSE
jgi:paraquat-inducible protein B